MYNFDEIYNIYRVERESLEANGFVMMRTPTFVTNELSKNRETGEVCFMIHPETGFCKAISISAFSFVYLNGIRITRVTIARAVCTIDGVQLSTPSCSHWYTINCETYFDRPEEYIDFVKSKMLKAYYKKRGFKNA